MTLDVSVGKLSYVVQDYCTSSILRGMFCFSLLFLVVKGPRSRSYGRTAAMRLIVQPYDEDDDYFLSFS
jgi:hypothetical protein